MYSRGNDKVILPSPLTYFSTITTIAIIHPITLKGPRPYNGHIIYIIPKIPRYNILCQGH